jgi:tetratricopeptide (TPR) repeat protein
LLPILPGEPMAYTLKRQIDQAIVNFNKLLEIDPRKAEAYFHRGAAYGMKNQYDQVIADCTRALEMDPQKMVKTYGGEAYAIRGLAYLRKGQYDRAIADYTTFLQTNPRAKAIAYLDRGKAYAGKREFDKAWDDVHQAQNLGAKVDPKFLQELRQASGREN